MIMAITMTYDNADKKSNTNTIIYLYVRSFEDPTLHRRQTVITTLYAMMSSISISFAILTDSLCAIFT